MSSYYTVNQICEILEAPSVHSTTLYFVHQFQDKKDRNPGFSPEKKAINTMDDCRHNLAVSAFLALEAQTHNKRLRLVS